jgi:hypothetical protein
MTLTREINLFAGDFRDDLLIKRGSDKLYEALKREHPARIAGLQRNQQKDRSE